MKKAVAIILVVLMLVSSTACCFKHEWEDATCTEPRTCEKCGKTEGEELGHEWEDATCILPKTCSVCGATKGDALGHTWIEATCTEPKTCSVCKATEGEPLGHDGVWETATVDNITATETLCSKCSVCGEQLETKEEAIRSFVGDNGTFTFTAKEFVERLQSAWNEQNGSDLPLTFKYSVSEDGEDSLDFYNVNDFQLGSGLFFDADNNGLKAGKDAAVGSFIIGMGVTETLTAEMMYYLLTLLCGPVCTAADPSIPNGEIYQSAIINNTYHFTDFKSLNGIYYSLGYDEDSGLLYIQVKPE